MATVNNTSKPFNSVEVRERIKMVESLTHEQLKLLVLANDELKVLKEYINDEERIKYALISYLTADQPLTMPRTKLVHKIATDYDFYADPIFNILKIYERSVRAQDGNEEPLIHMPKDWNEQLARTRVGIITSPLEKGRVLGFDIVSWNDETIFCHYIFILPPFRRKGLLTSIINEQKNSGRRIIYGTEDATMVRILAKMGFKCKGPMGSSKTELKFIYNQPK